MVLKPMNSRFPAFGLRLLMNILETLFFNRMEAEAQSSVRIPPCDYVMFRLVRIARQLLRGCQFKRDCGT